MRMRVKNAWRTVASAASSIAVIFAGCMPSAATPDTESLPPPFNVSDYFSPTGYEGDGADVEDTNLVTMVNQVCPTRSPNPVGDCYSITYDDGAPEATAGFAGVLWQFPENNFGEYPGHTVLPGATSVVVWARGGSGGEQVIFQVGGIDDPSFPFHDSILNLQTSPYTLTTDWQEFTIGLPSTYGAVLGGFGWIVKPAVADIGAGGPPIVFYLDGIQWQK